MTTTTKADQKPKDDAPPVAALVTLEDKRARLRAVFPSAAYGKLPKALKKDSPKGKCSECGGWHGLPAVHLDYVGHATVTDRLLEVDPEWTWEPCAFGPDGLPRFIISEAGTPIGLWIKLTVLKVTRLGFGSVESNAFEPEKQLIGDALRNAAMRFGVALDLWSKAELESAALAHEAQKSNGHATATEPAKPQPPKTLAQAAERAQPPRTVEAKPVPPKQTAPAQAASQPQGAGPEFDALPEYHPDGSVTVFKAITVPKDVIGLWGRWKSDKAAKPDSKMKSLAGRTWLEVTQGSLNGGREETLQHVVVRNFADIKAGNGPDDNILRWVQKAAWALHTMYSERAEADAERTRNDEFREQTGVTIDPSQPSPVLFDDSVPF